MVAIEAAQRKLIAISRKQQILDFGIHNRLDSKLVVQRLPKKIKDFDLNVSNPNR